VAVVQHLNPETASAPAGKYSQLAITAANTRIAAFSGQIGTTSRLAAMPAGAAEQAQIVFTAIETLLRSQGATPAHLIRLMTFIVGRDNLAEFNTVRDQVYSDWFPDGDYPANTVALVAGLAAPPMLIEIEGSFVCPVPAT